jgi:uncharacterized caspase-like protein
MRLALGFILLLLLFVLPAAADKRVALVIGNSSYTSFVALPNATTDAKAMAEKLQGLGFEVIVGVDLDMKAMQQRLKDFEQKLPDSDVAALFYSGHGFLINSTSFVVPIDAVLKQAADIKTEAIAVSTAIAAMTRLARINLVFLDCNRDNPFGRTADIPLDEPAPAPVAKDGGIMLAFSTGPGEVTFEGKGTHTPFATALLKHLGTPGEDIMRNLAHVRLDVFTATNGAQTPWTYSTLKADFVLKPAAP